MKATQAFQAVMAAGKTRRDSHSDYLHCSTDLIEEKSLVMGSRPESLLAVGEV